MILCGGEALFDMLPARTATGQSADVPRTGGAICDTAPAPGRLGVPAGFLCALSRDPFGALPADALAAAGVDTALWGWIGRPR